MEGFSMSPIYETFQSYNSVLDVMYETRIKKINP